MKSASLKGKSPWKVRRVQGGGIVIPNGAVVVNQGLRKVKLEEDFHLDQKPNISVSMETEDVENSTASSSDAHADEEMISEEFTVTKVESGSLMSSSETLPSPENANFDSSSSSNDIESLKCTVMQLTLQIEEQQKATKKLDQEVKKQNEANKRQDEVIKKQDETLKKQNRIIKEFKSSLRTAVMSLMACCEEKEEEDENYCDGNTDSDSQKFSECDETYASVARDNTAQPLENSQLHTPNSFKKSSKDNSEDDGHHCSKIFLVNTTEDDRSSSHINISTFEINEPSAPEIEEPPENVEIFYGHQMEATQDNLSNIVKSNRASDIDSSSADVPSSSSWMSSVSRETCPKKVDLSIGQTEETVDLEDEDVEPRNIVDEEEETADSVDKELEAATATRSYPEGTAFTKVKGMTDMDDELGLNADMNIEESVHFQDDDDSSYVPEESDEEDGESENELRKKMEAEDPDYIGKRPATANKSPGPSTKDRSKRIGTTDIIAKKSNDYDFKCLQCEKKYKSKYSLQDHVQHDHQNEVAGNKCPFCPSVMKYSKHLKRHIQVLHEGLRYKCIQCPGTFKRIDQLVAHEDLAHGKDGQSKPKCSICGVYCRSMVDFQNHMRRVHQQKVRRKPPKQVVQKKTERKRPKSMTSRLSSRIFQCHLCPISFSGLEDLRGHLNKTHGIIQELKDKNCSVEISSVSMETSSKEVDLNVRQTRNKKETSSMDDVNSQDDNDEDSSYVPNETEEEHDDKIDDDDPDFNGKRPATKSRKPSNKDVRTKRSRATDTISKVNGYFKCLQCEKKYTKKTYLRMHVKRDHENQVLPRYQCQYCTKSYPYRNNLKKHIQTIHEGVRHPCRYCPGTFKHMSDLYGHEKTIHAEGGPPRPKCEICGIHCLSFHGVRMHMAKAHKQSFPKEAKKRPTKPKPSMQRKRKTCRKDTTSRAVTRVFQCQLCVNSFPEKDDLRCHLKEIHGVDPETKDGSSGERVNGNET